MSHTANFCDDRLLLDVIDDRLDGARFETMLSHIEACERCRRRMEELAANQKQWHRTMEVLSSSAHDDDKSNTYWKGSPLPTTYLPDQDGCSETKWKELLSPPSHPEMLGRLGRYEVERLIGAGGMGVVFKGFDTELNRPVAIKVLAPHLSGSGSARQRFAREARAAAAVVHDHVVPIHNVETEGDTPFLVMKFIAGESLQSRLDREGPLELHEILRIGMQVASGLAAAHEQGLVHRDIKPPNILLEQGLERALITDFGLARTVDDASLTHTGFHAGTPQYMSPEQVSGNSVDCRSDLFSLGSVIYAMCTGRSPFRADNSFAVMKRIAEETPRSIREINPRVPQWLECIVAKLLVKQPDQRMATAHEASQLLAKCLAHVQNPSGHELPAPVETWMKQARRAELESQSRRRSHSAVELLAGSRFAFLFVLGLVCIIPLALILTRNGMLRDGRALQDGQPEMATSKTPQAVLDSQVEWDAGFNALRELKQEVEQLEAKLQNALDYRQP